MKLLHLGKRVGNRCKLRLNPAVRVGGDVSGGGEATVVVEGVTGGISISDVEVADA